MVTVLEELTTEEQRSIVRFLCAEGLNANDLHKEMFPVCGGKCLSGKPVHRLANSLTCLCAELTSLVICTSWIT
jgi:hypothetical protein